MQQDNSDNEAFCDASSNNTTHQSKGLNTY